MRTTVGGMAKKSDLNNRRKAYDFLGTVKRPYLENMTGISEAS